MVSYGWVQTVVISIKNCLVVLISRKATLVLYAWTTNVYLVLVPIGSWDSVGTNATLPEIAPDGNKLNE